MDWQRCRLEIWKTSHETVELFSLIGEPGLTGETVSPVPAPLTTVDGCHNYWTIVDRKAEKSTLKTPPSAISKYMNCNKTTQHIFTYDPHFFPEHQAGTQEYIDLKIYQRYAQVVVQHTCFLRSISSKSEFLFCAHMQEIFSMSPPIRTGSNTKGRIRKSPS